ncbi:C40 family peptidase [Arcticibacterium luteifluviistationis]|uniref:Glycoside hydrolase n=1 Tax=Arcticibacterium luteifluviistationis TaxID=1784714 RepID=A0A2Z4G8Q8_9BACT|nr:C40 family peptidase [Arcticibacterium luteifluviistationis]AWV97602.1 glycoside hydrolase [Arcticibacterium luteifluviistationis]
MESPSRQRIVLIIAVFCFFLVSCRNSAKDDGLLASLEALKTEYAPDGRTSVFNYEIVDDSLKGQIDNSQLHQKVKKLVAGLNLVEALEPLPSVDLADTLAYINVSVGNMRSKAAESSELSTQALLGTPLRVLEKSGSWYRVQTPDGYIGFIENSAIAFHNSFDAQKNKVLYTGAYGFSYQNASLQGLKVSDLTFGNIFKKLESGSVSTKVQYPDERIAYISSSELQSVESFVNDSKPQGVIKASQEFLGIPYLWGGTSWKGVDCSGFTRTSFMMNGIYLPRDASQQALVGDRVDTYSGFDKLKEGDLLFFGRHTDNGTKVTHVAVYLGGLKFIHSSGMVRYGSFDPNSEFYDSYNLNRFLFAKRIIDSKSIRYLNTQNFY